MTPVPFVPFGTKYKKCPLCGRKVAAETVEPIYHRCVEKLVASKEGRDRGLGDTIARLTTALGIPPCGGCEERQEKLNKLLPYST